jgi:hypothetical protein
VRPIDAMLKFTPRRKVDQRKRIRATYEKFYEKRDLLLKDPALAVGAAEGAKSIEILIPEELCTK